MPHNAVVHELTSADLTRGRLNFFWVQLLLTLAVAGLVLVEMGAPFSDALETSSRYPLGSLPYLAGGTQLTVVALAFTVWFAPVLTLVWMVPAAWLAPSGGSEVPTAWHALSLVCAATLVALFVRSRRARPAVPRRRPPVGVDLESSWAIQRARLGWVAVAGGVALAVGLMVAHQLMMVDVRDFETRAVPVPAEVVAYDDEYYEVVVRIDGTEFTLAEPEEWESPAVGDSVPVLVDPEDPENVRLAASPKDPSWLFGLGLLAPLVGLRWGLPIILRARRRRDLISVGAGWTRVRLVGTPDGGFRVLPTDASLPFLDVETLEGMVPYKDAEDALFGFEDEDEEEEEEEEEDEGASLPEDDAELAEWADDFKRGWDILNEDEEEEPWDFSDLNDEQAQTVQAITGPNLTDAEPFDMYGPWTHGASVALVRETGQVWLGELREPRFRTGSRPALLPRGRSHPGSGTHDSAQPPAHGKAADKSPDGFREALLRWSAPRQRWLRWVVASGVAALGAVLLPLLVGWMAEDGWGVFDSVRAVALAVGLLPWPSIAASAVGSATTGRSSRGVMSYGWFVDETVARDRVVSVIPGQVAVAIRLRDPEDAMAVLPEDIVSDLDPEGAATRLRSWLAMAPDGARSGRRLSPGLLATVAMTLVWAVAIVAVLP